MSPAWMTAGVLDLCSRRRPRAVMIWGGAAALAALLAVGCTGDAAPPTSGPGRDTSAGPASSPPVRAAADEPSPLAGVAPVAPPPEAPPPADRPLEEVLAEVGSAVVRITSQDALGRENGLGSGFLVDASGLAVTNFHVIENAVSASAQLRDGRKLQVVGYRALAPDRDLAVIQLADPPADLKPLRVGDPGELKQGQKLVAIGHPAGFEFTVSDGIVSAVRSTLDLPPEIQGELQSGVDTTWVQTTAAISGGNSGGPLLTADGRLAGVNAWIARGENLAFAVHVRHVRETLDRLTPEPSPLPPPGAGLVVDPEVAAIMEELTQEVQMAAQAIAVEARGPMSRPDMVDKVWQRVPARVYVDRLLAVADAQPRQTPAQQALTAVVRLAVDPLDDLLLFRQAVSRLRTQHLEERRMTEAALELARTPTPEVQELLYELLNGSPHPEVRAAASVALVQAFQLLDQGGGVFAAETTAVARRGIDEGGQVFLGRTHVRDLLEPLSFQAQNLAIGRPALPIEGQDLQGQPLKLSDHRGQVVVLEFWADWCPYCRESYGALRAAQTTRRGKPFAILGINGDEGDRGLFAERRNEVTWRSWRDGPTGPIAAQWGIESYPKNFVLDERGVIRYRDLRGEDLNRAIEELFAEQSFRLPGDLVDYGVAWRYWDRPEPPAAGDWRAPDYNDAAWPRGPAPLGFGWGDEATRLGATEAERDGLRRAYFRTTFEAPDPAALPGLAAVVCYDDGVTLYLNGVEAYRSNMPPPDTSGVKARGPASSNGHGLGQLARLDRSLLRRGKNVLAVEIHQAWPHNGDLRFDLALFSNLGPSLVAKLMGASTPEKQFALNWLWGLGPDAASAAPLIRGHLNSPDEAVRNLALHALAATAPEARSEPNLGRSAGPANPLERMALASEANGRAWRVAMLEDASPFERQLAYTEAWFAHVLAPDEADIVNTLALAECRVGRYQEGLDDARASSAERGKNPLDLCIAVLANLGLGREAKARTALAQAQELMRSEAEWKDHPDAQDLLRQAEAALAQYAGAPAG